MSAKPTSVQEARSRVLSQSCCCEDASAFDDDQLADARAELERDLDRLIAAVRAEEQARVRQVANDVVDSHEYSEQDWMHGYPSKQSERMARQFTDGLRAGVARVLAALTDGGAA